MRFKAFEKAISELNTLRLPGVEAQLKMAPPFREELIEQYKEKRKTAKHKISSKFHQKFHQFQYYILNSY